MRPDDEPEDVRRWREYRELFQGRGLDAVIARLRDEQDGALASAVVVHCLEHVDEERFPDLLGAAPEGPRDFDERRAAETILLRGILRGDRDSLPGPPDDYTDWFQRRVAAESGSTPILTLLAKEGRTRRVRAAARERLRLLGR